ncbi:MAG: lipoate--protein ligase family protein [Candidatus Aenigmarchaeota archaeon]|nr:lipoate--protein ligase family protein [Candidatus Aenigmarchaeota archaeon]
MFDYEYWGNRPFSGAVNMALEEFMLKRAAETGKAMARFYSFPQDTVVLGYAQATDALKTKRINVVRRATGGSHVQTGPNILAYSFAAPRHGFSGIEDLRRHYAGCIEKAFADLGIENAEADNKASCINVNGKLAAAHATIWGVGSGLIHGLLAIDPYDMEKLAQRITLGTRVINGKVYSEYDAIRNMPTIASLLPELAKAAPQRTEALKAIIGNAILKEVAEGKHENKSVDESIIAAAYPLLEKRYGAQPWTNERTPAFSEEEIEEIPGEEINGPLKKGLGYCMYLQVQDRDFKTMAEDDRI